jgi:Ca-activated chloride channel homolog
MKTIMKIGLLLVMLFASQMFSQERVITGTVSDFIGPLPGANVVLKGTKIVTQTDFDGKYSIKANTGQTLVFSLVGMAEASVIVSSSNTINVVLINNSSNLNEVVVTGYGIKKEKKVLGYSVSIVQANSISRALSGKVAGLQVGASPNSIVIRGMASDQKSIKKAMRLQEKKDKEAKVSVDDTDYNTLIENVFESPKSEPLSTFSIDVDNASYTNVRQFINNGQKVPNDAVRVEEMVNFFRYTYPQPTSEHPFSINTEYNICPWNTSNKLIRIGLQGKDIQDGNLPASNLVFLIDVSGSMDQVNKLPLLVQSLKVLVNQLREKDKVAIVVYAGAAGLVLPPTTGDKKMTIIDALDKLQSGGSTAGGAGIQLAYKTAEENFIKNGNNRVILATDGDFNVGASSDADMQTLIEEKRKSGVFLTCLGYGMGNYKDSKLEILADKGNGNYAYIDNIQEANRFLGKEFKGSMFAIAKDVKIQIEFNPAHVKAYRLIGYENRKLRPEDFKDDVIDAGELGSGHTVTALYEIITTNSKSDFYTEQNDLKYSKVENKGTDFREEFATIKFRYKKPEGSKSIEMVQIIENKVNTIDLASEDFKFSTAVAWFGLKLRDSKFISDKSSDAIKKLAKQGVSSDSEGYKAEFIRLVEAVN